MSDAYTPGLLTRLPAPPRKVALLRASRIGDFVCATPALRALRVALPEAEITMITLPMLQDLVLRSPYLDRFVPFPGFPGIAEQFFNPRHTVEFLRQMQFEHFDLAVQMHESGVNSNPFMLLLGAKVTAGFIRENDPPGLLNAALPIPRRGHEVQRILALTTFLGAPPQDMRTSYPLWPEDDTQAAALLSHAAQPYIGLHLGAREETRRWPLDRFALVGAILQRRYGGTIVIIGEAEERSTAEYIVRRLGTTCLNLTGQTSLTVLGAIIAKLMVLVTNDTGPAHISYALGTPTVTIFGTGDPWRYGPPHPGPYRALVPERHHQPDGANTAFSAYPLAIESITVEQVVEAAESLMNNVPRTSHLVYNTGRRP